MSDPGDVETPIESADATPRVETCLRILLSLLFLVILRVVEVVLGAVIAFSLLFTLVTRREVDARVRGFANRVLSYVVAVTLYLTYNADDLPFPFDEFPPEFDYAPRSKR